MTDLELAQQALPEPNITSVFGYQSWSKNQLIDMFLAGMAKAREIDAKDAARADTADAPLDIGHMGERSAWARGFNACLSEMEAKK
jgi:hypothetical protein